MQFTADADNFREAYKLVVRAVGKKSSYQVLTQVLIDASGRSVVLCATDNDVTVCAEVLGCTITQPGKGLISPALMGEVVKALKNGEVDVKSKSDRRVTIGSAGVSSPTIVDPEEFPALKYETASSSQFVVNTADFAYAVSFVLPAVSTDDGRPNLTGVFLQATDPDKVTAVATDGHRMGLCSMRGSSEYIKDGIIIPKRSCELLLRIVTGIETTLTVEGSSVYCHTRPVGNRGNVWCQLRLIDASFPDFRRVLPNTATAAGPRFAPFSCADLTEAVTVIVAEEKAALKALDGNDKSMIRAVSVEGREGFGFSSSAAERLLSEGETTTVAFLASPQIKAGTIKAGFNPGYWTDLCGVLRENTASIAVIDALSPVTITPETGLPDVTITAIVMPMRL